MPNFGSFLQGIGLAAGNNILVGQQMEEQQASIDYKRNQVAMQKMQMLQSQQQMDNQKKEGEFFAAQSGLDQAGITNPMNVAKAATAASLKAGQLGDLKGMKRYADLAKEKTAEARDAETLHLKEQQEKKEGLSTAAADYSSEPSEANAGALIQKAIGAGVPPSSIPMGDPVKFKTWANNQQMASMTGKERVTLLSKERDRQEALEEKKREFKIREDDLRESRRQTAALREATLQASRERAADRKDKAHQTIPTGEGQAVHDPDHKISGPRWDRNPDYAMVGKPMLASEKAVVAQVIGAAAEGARNLRVISSMPVGATSSAFEGLHNGTILESLGKVGTNVLTPQSSQMYDTVLKGLGLDIGRVVTAGGGRGVNQAQVNEFKDMARRAPGDTEFVAMFKVANASDIIRNRMTTLQNHPDPKLRAQQKEIEDYLGKIPLPEQVLAEAMKHKDGSKVLSLSKSLGVAAEKIKKGTLEADVGGKLSPEHQALFDKY